MWNMNFYCSNVISNICPELCSFDFQNSNFAKMLIDFAYHGFYEGNQAKEKKKTCECF